MKATIKDKKALSILRPLDIVSYLRAKGWELKRENNDFLIWVLKNAGEDTFEVIVPLNPNFADFALRIGDILKTLEAAEKRSQSEIFDDITFNSSDIVKIRIITQNPAENSLPLENGVEIIQQIREMMLATTYSAIDPVSVLPAKKPGTVTNHMRKLKLGQTERGSYIITIVSKVTPQILQTRFTEESDLITDEPFERKVISTLACSLYEMKIAAEKAATTGLIDSFASCIQFGVSANLCESIASIGKLNEVESDLEIDFKWALTHPKKDPIEKIIISADELPWIEAAARKFREVSIRYDFEIRGPVIKLSRPNDQIPGLVTVYSYVDEKPRRITFELSGGDYHKAVAAHDNGSIVTCYGTLYPKSKIDKLEDVRDFSVQD